MCWENDWWPYEDAPRRWRELKERKKKKSYSRNTWKKKKYKDITGYWESFRKLCAQFLHDRHENRARREGSTEVAGGIVKHEELTQEGVCVWALRCVLMLSTIIRVLLHLCERWKWTAKQEWAQAELRFHVNEYAAKSQERKKKGKDQLFFFFSSFAMCMRGGRDYRIPLAELVNERMRVLHTDTPAAEAHNPLPIRRET